MASAVQEVSIALESHHIPPLQIQRDGDGVLRSGSNDDSTAHRGLYQQLKPVDGGIAAWKVLFAAFMFEAILWGTNP